MCTYMQSLFCFLFYEAFRPISLILPPPPRQDTERERQRQRDRDSESTETEEVSRDTYPTKDEAVEGDAHGPDV